MMLPLKDHGGIETVLNLLLIRFGIIAAIVVVVAIVLFAIALWLRRCGSLGQTSRRAAPLVRKAAEYRSRNSRGQNDLMSAGLSSLASALERRVERRDEEPRDGAPRDERHEHDVGDAHHTGGSR